MMHKAWCNIEKVPYNFSRSSIKFQGHTGWKIDDLNPIWVRLLGRPQLSNPSDLPCFGKYGRSYMPGHQQLWYWPRLGTHTCRFLRKANLWAMNTALYVFTMHNNTSNLLCCVDSASGKGRIMAGSIRENKVRNSGTGNSQSARSPTYFDATPAWSLRGNSV